MSCLRKKTYKTKAELIVLIENKILMSKAYNSHSSGYNFKLFKLLDIGEKMEK
jgi:hypothetical protein